MKTVIMQGPGERLVFSEQAVPRPGENQLLLKVKACGICGTDLHWVQLGLAKPGTVLGHEFSGEVVEVGPGAEPEWRPGDRVVVFPILVCGTCNACLTGNEKACSRAKSIGLGYRNAQGAYAEYVLVDKKVSFKIPDTVSWEAAACIEPFSVGLYAIRRADVAPGQNILVVGAGPIGLTAVNWSRFCGAGRVLVSERSFERMRLALKMGADDVIDINEEKDVGAAFAKKTGAAPDLIVEAVGVPGMIQECIELAPSGGRIVVAGVCNAADRFHPGMAVFKNLEIRFSVGYEWRDFRLALDMAEQGRITPESMITHTVSLDELPEMFEALKKPVDQCKVIIAP
ncbi:MAG: alcohol dehydrogenase catalytic domain-containing protein [Desulfobacterales bacterium]